MRIIDVADALAPDAEKRVVGIRPGEKLHEVMVTEDEARNSYDLGDRFVILPHGGGQRVAVHAEHGEALPDGFRYSSEGNDRWLSSEELLEMAASIQPARRMGDRAAAPGWEA
jgi:UDP-N-acetylglucosamine 4,6-dehydratase